jgi:hypothetical protein
MLTWDIGEPETGFALREVRTNRMTITTAEGDKREHESRDEKLVTLGSRSNGPAMSFLFKGLILGFSIAMFSANVRSAGSSLVAPSATTASASISTATVAASASVATATAFTRRASFVHHDVAAHEILAVESLDRAIGFLIVVHFNETEPARLARELVSHQGHVRNGCARLLKPIA